ncbi:MAG: hypothetical protein JXR76_01030 [Deltaproteobacteria bacterium]|nr:hypothetical protein [Deltaproteobacteria bacterium]
MKTFPNGWYPPTTEMIRLCAETRPHKVVCGHYPFSLSEQLPNYKTATFLREPIARAISLIEHRKRCAPRLRNLTYEQIINREKEFVSKQLLNYQTKVMSMTLGDVNAVAGPIVESALTEAAKNMQRLDFLGITDQFQQSCAIFDHQFGTQLSQRISRQNVGNYRAECSQKDRDFIASFLNLDIALYALAKEQFAQRNEIDRTSIAQKLRGLFNRRGTFFGRR